MNETFRKLVNLIAGNFLWVILSGTAAGILFGVVTSLIDGNFFVEVLVIDGIVGFVAALFAGLIALYLRFRLGSGVDPLPRANDALPMAADESKLRRKLDKATKARKYTLLVMPMVAISTVFQYLGIFAPGNLPPWSGLVVLALCAIQIPFLTRTISSIETSISESSV